MRIVAGIYSSRKLEAPKGDNTRPTLDQVREAVFSSLGTYFDGGIFLDLYAGSGANGLEAISRGIDKAIFVDKSYEAINCIKKNINTLGCEDKCRILKMTDMKALNMFIEENIKFDLVYLDPPYAKQHNQEILTILNDNKLLNENAVVVIESDKSDEFKDEYSSLKYFKEVIYGQTKITYYKQTN